MWVKKTQLEIEEEKKIKKSKRFKNALIDSSVFAFVFFASQIILLKIIGQGGKYSNNVEEPLAWTEITKQIPALLGFSFAVFAVIFLYEFFSGKRIWKKETSSTYICDRCKKTNYKSTMTKCECGGTILNANEFKWIPDSNS